MTRTRRAVLTAVVMFIDVANYPPTLTDLAHILGLSPSTIAHHLGRLERDGYLELDSGTIRGIRVTDKGSDSIPLANASERTAPRAVTT